MTLRPYRDTWPADDPHANFKSEVALYTTTDPLPTLERLSSSKQLDRLRCDMFTSLPRLFLDST